MKVKDRHGRSCLEGLWSAPVSRGFSWSAGKTADLSRSGDFIRFLHRLLYNGQYRDHASMDILSKFTEIIFPFVIFTFEIFLVEDYTL